MCQVQEHEKSKSHRECYIAWRELERRLLSKKWVDSLLELLLFNAVKKLAENFEFLRNYPSMCECELEKKARRLAHQYPSDLNDEYLAEDMQYLQVVHKANFGKPELKPLELLNLLTECN